MTALRSSSPMIGLPNGISRMELPLRKPVQIRDLGWTAFGERTIDGVAHRHGRKDLVLVHVRPPPLPDCVDKGWYERAFRDARIGGTDLFGCPVRIARALDRGALPTVLEGRLRPVDQDPMEMRFDAAEIHRDLAEAAVVERQGCNDQVISGEAGLTRADPGSVGVNLQDPAAGQPQYQVRHMDAAAQHGGISRDAAAPAVGEFPKAAVIIVGLDEIDPTQFAARDAPAEIDEAGRTAQNRIRRQPQVRGVRQCLPYPFGLVLGYAKRLF